MDREEMRKALSRAFNYGQTYFAQSDSESYSQNKRADKTWADYERFVKETIAAMAHSCEELTIERDALRRALEVIAVGDAKDPVTDAADELVALGYWRAEAVAAKRRHGG